MSDSAEAERADHDSIRVKLLSFVQTPLCLSILLSVSILAVYGQVSSFDYVYYDDSTYVFQNPNVLTGLSLDNFLWAFNVGYQANWHPVTWISHQLDASLFGISPAGHHMVNLLFHLANSLLLFWVMRRSTGNILLGAGVAFLFAVHPLRAESVAWIAERKDVLFMFWGILALHFYVRWVDSKKVSDYLAVFGLLALSLMSKPMLVTLPVLLLIFDYWPLNRVSLEFEDFRRRTPRLILEKLPFFALSIASSVMTVIAQDRGGALHSLSKLPFDARVSNAIVAYVKYIGMMIWPSNLAFDYPHPVHGTSGLTILLCSALLIAITFVFWWIRDRHPYFLMGWAWYLVTMIPVIGLVQVGYQSMADRYTYFSQIGLSLILAYACVLVLDSGFVHRRVLLALAVGVSALLMVATFRQVETWRNLDSLMDHALAIDEGHAKAHFGKGLAYYFRNEDKEAKAHFEEALRIAPHYKEVRHQLGLVEQRIRQRRFQGY